MISDSNKYDQIAAFLSGNSSEEETRELKEWRLADPAHELLFQELATIWDLQEDQEDISWDTDKSWNALQHTIQVKKGAGPGLRRMSLWWSVAAGFMLMAGLVFWLLQPSPEQFLVQTTQGETREIVLPDSSIIWLNENSQIAYQVPFKDRVIHLKGEAFFDVAKRQGARFTVFTPQATTTVLGTSFNLRAYADEASEELFVETGKVSFSKTAVGEEIVVITGEAARLQDQAPKPEKVDFANATAWKTKTLIFENTPVGEVLETLTRVFHQPISLANPAISHCRFNGHFYQTNLKEVLEVLTFAMDLELQETDQSLVINGKGCHE